MTDQEAQDFYKETVVGEQVEQQEETAPAVVEPVAPANQALIAERQAAQVEARQLREELHDMRRAMLQRAMLQQAAVPPQNQDPIGTAMKRIESKMDPDAFKFTAPMGEMILQELHAMQQRENALIERNQYLEQAVNEIAQDAKSRKIYAQLAQAIPDLDAIGPQLTAMLGKYPADVQQMYIDNPKLLVPLADSLRTTTGAKPGKNVQAERAKIGLDLGVGERATPITANDIQAMKPGSAEFEKERAKYWRED